MGEEHVVWKKSMSFYAYYQIASIAVHGTSKCTMHSPIFDCQTYLASFVLNVVGVTEDLVTPR